MKHSYELVAIVDEREDLITRRRAWMERRALSPGAELEPTEIPTDLDRFLPGNRYGRFDERISRREVCNGGIPAWFDTREHPGQYGIIMPNRQRVYIQVALDLAKRAQPSTFDTRIETPVERKPEQASLLD